jgi:hypothetical protein
MTDARQRIGIPIGVLEEVPLRNPTSMSSVSKKGFTFVEIHEEIEEVEVENTSVFKLHLAESRVGMLDLRSSSHFLREAFFSFREILVAREPLSEFLSGEDIVQGTLYITVKSGLSSLAFEHFPVGVIIRIFLELTRTCIARPDRPYVCDRWGVEFSASFLLGKLEVKPEIPLVEAILREVSSPAPLHSENETQTFLRGEEIVEPNHVASMASNNEDERNEIIEALSDELESLKHEKTILEERLEIYHGRSSVALRHSRMLPAKVDFDRANSWIGSKCAALAGWDIANHFSEIAQSDPGIAAIDGMLVVCTNIDSKRFSSDSIYRKTVKQHLDTFLRSCLIFPLRFQFLNRSIGGKDALEEVVINGYFIPRQHVQLIEGSESPRKSVDLIELIRHPTPHEPTHELEMEEGKRHSERVSKIIELLDSNPSEDFELATKDMQLLLDSVRTEIAERLTPLINAKLQSMPCETYEDKKAICHFVKEALHPIFMAVKSPTGKPSTLTPSGNRSEGVFRFKEPDESGRKVNKGSSAILPEITLVPDPPRGESQQKLRE